MRELFFIGLFFFLIPMTYGGTIEITNDYEIVVPDVEWNVSNSPVWQAAQHLEAMLEKIDTGLSISIVKESNASDPAFYLGATDKAENAGIDLDQFTKWKCLCRTISPNIFLIGNDGTMIGGNVTWHDRFWGTMKAVIIFLEHIGVRYVHYGTNGYVAYNLPYPTEIDIHMDIHWSPSLEFYTAVTPASKVGAIAWNCFSNDGTFKSCGGHSWSYMVPVGTYYADHPEYFALYNGQRLNSRKNHLCISNKDVQDLMVAWIVEQIDAGYEIVALGQNDGHLPCQCDECAKISEDPGERIWIVHRELARRVQMLRPDARVAILSYVHTNPLPTTIESFPPNVIIWTTEYNREKLDMWREAFPGISLALYTYNWGYYQSPGFGPKRTSSYMDKLSKIVQDYGIIGIYDTGGYKRDSLFLNGPAQYIWAKLLGDPSLDSDILWLDYFRATYGHLDGWHVRLPFMLLEKAIKIWSDFYKPLENSISENPWTNNYTWYTQFITPELIFEWDDHLQKAEYYAYGDERVIANVQQITREWNYVKYLAEMYHLYKGFEIEPTEDECCAMKERYDAWDSLIDDMMFSNPPFGQPYYMGGASEYQIRHGSGPGGVMNPAKSTWNWGEVEECNSCD